MLETAQWLSLLGGIALTILSLYFIFSWRKGWWMALPSFLAGVAQTSFYILVYIGDPVISESFHTLSTSLRIIKETTLILSLIVISVSKQRGEKWIGYLLSKHSE